MKTNRVKKTRQTLEREIIELKAQLASSCHFASYGLNKLQVEKRNSFVLSGVYLGGREAIHPVCIQDGLSDDTIAALGRDIERSYQSMIEFKPTILKV